MRRVPGKKITPLTFDMPNMNVFVIKDYNSLRRHCSIYVFFAGINEKPAGINDV